MTRHLTRHWGKDLAIGAALLVFAVQMLGDSRVPLFSYIDLCDHWIGHFVTGLFPGVVNAMGGSLVQIGVPLALALYFLHVQGDESASALFFGWSATNVFDVARYMADAPFKRLPLFGTSVHEWTVAFTQLHVLASSHAIALGMRAIGGLLMLSAVALLARPYIRQLTGSTMGHTAPAA